MVNRIFIKVILVVLLLGLQIYLVDNVRNLDCNDCTISFIQTKQAGNPVDFKETYTAAELFNKSEGGSSCPIIWDRTWGYRGI
jgi:hypothetical protein